jgi:subtilisin family serine protease
VEGRVDWTSKVLPQWSIIEVPEGTVEVAAEVLRLDPAIEHVERDAMVRPCATPNDDYWPQQQASLDLMGIRCAWDKVTKATVIIAVLDDGVNYAHPDLFPNILKNSVEISGVIGVDDDFSGVNDDFYGASFLPHTDPQWVAEGNPRGNMNAGAAWHGTLMASIIGAAGNNESPANPSSYIAGAMWNGQMLPVQVYSFLSMSGTRIFKGMEYAYFRGARIMNLSFEMGSHASPQWMEQFMTSTPDVLYVAAAGNSGEDLEDPTVLRRYPAMFATDNLIVIGNADLNDGPYDFGSMGGTNWGAISVDVFATGVLWALDRNPGTPPTVGAGTSNSAAFTSGLAALIWTHSPGMTAVQVKQRIMDTADLIPALSGLCVTGARINAAAAVGTECD